MAASRADGAGDGAVRRFDDLYEHGFARVAVCLPRVEIGDPAVNLERTLELARRADEAGAAAAVFPELGLSGYSLDDLFHQSAVLEASKAALLDLAAASSETRSVLIAGLPLVADGAVFNAAAVVHGGRIAGIVPKTYLPNYREYYEKRYFAAAESRRSDVVSLGGADVPFGEDLLFDVGPVPGFRFHVEICEDLWSPLPPSTHGALAGASVLCNLSASNVTIGKADYRRLLCASQSGRSVAAYLYAGAGAGESTTDLAWDSHGLIYENGERLAESERFSQEARIILADLDLERLAQERRRMSTFRDAARRESAAGRFRRVDVSVERPAAAVALEREIPRFPYVPAESGERDERCAEAFDIQVAGLVQRLRATGIEKVVIGVSGGLDSSHALIVCVRALDRLGLPRANILGFTLPGFGTSSRTYENAKRLMAALGVTSSEIDIRPSSERLLESIGHPYSQGQRGAEVYDATFENVQAGERTSHLFRLANLHRGLVIGTGDLSELALGWCTYGVGDQMAHYSVNSSVPKTLIQHLIRWEVERGEFGAEAGRTLQSIIDTEISPELVPAAEGQETDDGEPAQSTEAVIGPFELQDFHLYYLSRYGYRPSRVAWLARQAWGDRRRGAWPDPTRETDRREYSLDEIKQWLEVFLVRFFGTSQFKRSALPNGPKVGSGGSLSPRGDWRAPSDGGPAVWVEELRRNVP